MRIAQVFGDTARQWQIRQSGVYRPLIAEIRIAEIGDAKQSPAQLAERACNQAILAAMGCEDETLLSQREQACVPIL